MEHRDCLIWESNIIKSTSLYPVHMRCLYFYILYTLQYIYYTVHPLLYVVVSSLYAALVLFYEVLICWRWNVICGSFNIICNRHIIILHVCTSYIICGKSVIIFCTLVIMMMLSVQYFALYFDVLWAGYSVALVTRSSVLSTLYAVLSSLWWWSKSMI